MDGKDTIGTPGGTTANDVFSNIVLPTDFDGVNNNFGEILASSIGGWNRHDFLPRCRGALCEGKTNPESNTASANRPQMSMR